jgi:hypothetical protein
VGDELVQALAVSRGTPVLLMPPLMGLEDET